MQLSKYKLKDLIDVTRGASLGGEYYATSGKYIRLTCGNFDYNNNCFKENTSKDNIYYTGTVRPEFIMKKGDIITPLTEQAIGLLGSTALIPDNDLYIQSQDVAKITCKNGLLDPSFAFYLISSALVKNQLSAGAQQTKIRHTSPDKIKDCVVWIPSLDEQRRIGSLLTSIDKKIALNKQINANLEAMAKQLYDYWFVQFDFPNEEGKPYKSSGGKMIWNETLKREIPEGWEESSILKKDIYNTDYTANGSFAGLAENVKYNYGDKYAIVIRIIDYNNNFSDYSKFVYINKDAYEYLSKSTLYGDEIIICNVGNVGITFRCPKLDYPMTLGPNGIMVNSNKYNNFLYMYFISEIGQQQLLSISAGSIQKKFNKTDFRNMSLVFPPDNILDCFNKLYQPIYDGIKSNNKKISILKNLRDSLLPLLMNGQVRIKEE